MNNLPLWNPWWPTIPLVQPLFQKHPLYFHVSELLTTDSPLRPLLLHFYGGLETWVPQDWPWQDRVLTQLGTQKSPPLQWPRNQTTVTKTSTHHLNTGHHPTESASNKFPQYATFSSTSFLSFHKLFAQSIQSHFHSLLVSSILAQPLLSEKKKILQGMFLKHVNDLLSWK